MKRRRAPLYGAPILAPALATWIVAILVAIGNASPRIAAYADGAPPGFSGGFDEQACDACHFESSINTRPGQLAVTGLPERFVAGERYTITVTLSHPTMKIAGFQLAARFETGGMQAGTLAAAPGEEKRITVETHSNVQYANQRLEGTTLVEPGTAKWTVVWTAPQSGGKVTLNAAANAADKDDATRGDYVYTAAASSVARLD